MQSTQKVSKIKYAPLGPSAGNKNLFGPPFFVLQVGRDPSDDLIQSPPAIMS